MSMLGAAREKTSPDHHVGIRLGSVRPNRKPVLLVTDPDGRPEVVAKLGWNALTRQLAEQSERRLRQLDGGDDVVLIPRSLGVTVHNGANVHWQSAIQIHEAVAVAPRALIAQALVRIASASPHHVADLAASPYAAGLRDRAAAIEHHLPGVQAVTERAIERHAVTPLAFGAWHGDFTPWNVAMVGQRLAVWDWERTADDVPVGLDAAHYHFPLASIASGRGLDAAATGRQQRLLELMGVSTSHHTAVMRLHMLELVHRFAEHERQHRLVVALMRLVERP